MTEGYVTDEPAGYLYVTEDLQVLANIGQRPTTHYRGTPKIRALRGTVSPRGDGL